MLPNILDPKAVMPYKVETIINKRIREYDDNDSKENDDDYGNAGRDPNDDGEDMEEEYEYDQEEGEEDGEEDEDYSFYTGQTRTRSRAHSQAPNKKS